MQITRYTDYSLRVLLYLSALQDGELAKITEISNAYGISRNHAVKVVHNLGKLGYVHTMRGRSGGIRLQLHPTQINLGTLVRNVEATLTPVNCEALACPLEGQCSLFGILNQAVHAYLDVLDGHTLADIIASEPTYRKIRFLLTRNRGSEELSD